MKKYHINPKTRMPSKCTAEPGNCPYGAEHNHFDTYSEAFLESQKRLEQTFDILPTNLNVLDQETELALANQEEQLNNLEMNMNKMQTQEHEFYERREEILNSTDPDMLFGIIDGSLDTVRDWTIIGAALRNKNLPKDYIDDIIYNNLDNYHLEFIRRLLCNPQLTSEDLNFVLNNTEDTDSILIAYMHPNLDREIVAWHIENNPKVAEYPYNGVLLNPSYRNESLVTDLDLKFLMEGIDPGFPLSRQIYSTYL